MGDRGWVTHIDNFEIAIISANKRVVKTQFHGL